VHEICHSSNNGVFVAIGMVLVVGGGIAILMWRGGAPRSRVAIFGGIIVAVVGFLAAMVLKPDPHFIAFNVGDGNLTLGFTWPKAAVTIPLSQLSEMRVEHGVVRQHEKGGSVHVSDIVWFALRAGSDSYRSCHQASSEHMVAAAKDLAAAANITPQYFVQCEDGHELASSAEDVGRGGDRWESELAPRCTAAK
jgi:hypothetical protein